MPITQTQSYFLIGGPGHGNWVTLEVSQTTWLKARVQEIGTGLVYLAFYRLKHDAGVAYFVEAWRAMDEHYQS